VNRLRINKRAWLIFGLIVFACASPGGTGSLRVGVVMASTGGQAASGTQPKIYVAIRTLDLGVLKEGVIAPVSYVLENHGDADLIIERAQGDCGCTVVKLSPEERIIPPGGKLTLKAEFNTAGRSGPGIQTKAIRVYTNDPIEREVKLEFTALVMSLFRRLPSGNLILQKTPRGKEATTRLELMAGSVGLDVEVLAVEFDPPTSLTASVGPFSERGRSGRRITFTVSKDAPLGMALSAVNVKMKIGEDTVDERIPLRVEVVGDLVYRPLVVDTTRKKSLRGQRLIPVTVESASNTPFKVLKAEGGQILNVIVQQGQRRGRIIYTIQPQIREDAPNGPFGAMLLVHTDSLDQPLLQIPVYGLVSPKIQVAPSLVMLRKDDTRIGMRRRVKLQASRPKPWEVLEIKSSHPFVSAKVDTDARSRYAHISYLTVALEGEVPPGLHEVTLSVSTDLPGAVHLSIPVTVIGPSDGD